MAKVSSFGGLDGFRGRLGNIVFSQGANGQTVARAYVQPHQAQTPKQGLQRTAMARTSMLWRNMTVEQAAEWTQYAQMLTTYDAQTGRQITPRPQNVFTSLSLKLLQIIPQAAVSLVPPTQAFFGDGIMVSAAGGAGSVVFTANHANSPDVLTELLIQPLASVHRKPEEKKYRSAGFVSFAAGGLSHTVSAEAGVTAVAVRFVNGLTGQASGLVVLGRVQVSAALTLEITGAEQSLSTLSVPQFEEEELTERRAA